MAMTLRPTEEGHDDLREIAEAEGVSLQEVGRAAVREYAARHHHRDRVDAAARSVLDRHAAAFRRLGE